MITLHRTTTDPKVATLQSSWLALSKRDARWLAANADIAVSQAGQPLNTDHFTYIPLDPAYAGTVIDATTADASLTCPTTVLVVPTSRMTELAGRATPICRALSKTDCQLVAA